MYSFSFLSFFFFLSGNAENRIILFRKQVVKESEKYETNKILGSYSIENAALPVKLLFFLHFSFPFLSGNFIRAAD